MNTTRKPVVVLVHGKPNHGKSRLAYKLKNDFGYRRITVDDVYVRFVRDRYPDLYFPRLRQFILGHWHHIVLAGRQGRWIVEDMEAAWRDHLYDVIEDELRSFSHIVVEGYLVEFALDELTVRLKNKVHVRIVKAENQEYFVDGKQASVEEIGGVREPPQ